MTPSKKPFLKSSLFALILPLITILGIIVTFTWGKIETHFEVDACLDRGGCYDYIDHKCRKEEKDAQKLCDRKK